MLFRKMEELKLISTETLRDLIHEKFERMPDYPKTAEEEDPLAKVCFFSFYKLENWIPNPQILPPTLSEKAETFWTARFLSHISSG